MKKLQQYLIILPLLLIISFCSLQSIFAQTGAMAQPVQDVRWPHRLTLGLGAGINLNFAAGTYTDDVGSSYKSGFGAAPTFFGMLEIPLAEKWMLVPRIHYSDYSGSFSDGVATGSVPVEKNFAYNLQTVGIDVLAKYVIGNFHILAGPSIATIIKKSYAHGTSSAASSSSQDLPGAGSVYAAIGAGIGYDIPVNDRHTVWLSPEAFYSFPFTNLGGSSNGDLKISTLRIALSVKFDIGSDPKPNELPPPSPSMSITARGVLPNGDPTQDPIVAQQVNRTRSSMTFLPYVFFDYNSAEIPARYNRDGATGFNTDMLAGKTDIDANHSGLDILGYRLRQYPDATVTLTGTNSNSGKERNNIELSRLRAMAIRDYLVKTWNIDAKRIIVDQRNLPELPTNPVTNAGMIENRRVEIASSDPRVTEPVKIETKQAQTVGETLVRFETNLNVDPRINITSWELLIDQNGSPLNIGDSGRGTPQKILTLKVPNAESLLNQPIHYQMNIYDANGTKYSADGMTRIVNKAVESANLEKYAMLSFDFDRAEINPRALQMVNLIGESISKDATGVNVTGFCDNTGADDYNQALSEARADAAIKNLRKVTNLPVNINTKGQGKRDPKFTNDLPEGRMLNRRVEVDIQKSSR